MSIPHSTIHAENFVLPDDDKGDDDMNVRSIVSEEVCRRWIFSQSQVSFYSLLWPPLSFFQKNTLLLYTFFRS